MGRYCRSMSSNVLIPADVYSIHTCALLVHGERHCFYVRGRYGSYNSLEAFRQMILMIERARHHLRNEEKKNS